MLRFLVVEDQPAVREVVAEISSELDGCIAGGVAVVQVASLAEARQALCDQGPWHCLITDMNLGDGNVLELIAEIRNQSISLPPVILMSGFLTASRMKQALELGIEHVLAKPFAPDLLIECLDNLFNNDKDVATEQTSPRIARSSDRLLPEMFEMDRRLGLVYRMFDEMPGHHDVSQICVSALNLAMEIVHARGGFLALFERQKQKLVHVATEGMADIDTSCQLNDTCFQAMINEQNELIQSDSDSCWPGMPAGSFIAVPVRLQGVSVGVLCLLQPVEVPLKVETRQILGLLVKKLDTLLDNRAVHAALAANMRETLIALVRSLEARDRYTRDHSERVGALAAILAHDLGLDADHVDLIRTGGLLHDIGKCGVPDSVLLKPGRYTDQEYSIMKAHPAIGDNILANMDTMVRERLMLRHHHERYDGFGYPDKLAGEDIPLDARIVCVADAIDAMTTHRVYRMARPLSFCLEQLKLNSGTQFDPKVVEVAIAAIQRGEVETQAEAHHKSEGVMPLSTLISVKTEVRSYG
ncbi:MAG: HD domain-containing protein [Mariprofundus sp.]